MQAPRLLADAGRGVRPALAVTLFLLALAMLLAPPRLRADDLAWLEGGWSSEQGGVLTVESWGPRDGERLPGRGLVLRDGEILFFEALEIVGRGDALTYVPFPGGRTSPAAFRLTHRDAKRVVFEDPTHDFPQRLDYRRLDADTLEIHVSGSGRSLVLRHRRVCRWAPDPRGTPQCR